MKKIILYLSLLISLTNLSYGSFGSDIRKKYKLPKKGVVKEHFYEKFSQEHSYDTYSDNYRKYLNSVKTIEKGDPSNYYEDYHFDTYIKYKIPLKEFSLLEIIFMHNDIYYMLSDSVYQYNVRGFYKEDDPYHRLSSTITVDYGENEDGIVYLVFRINNYFDEEYFEG